MSNVYFKELEDFSNKELVNDTIYKMIDKIVEFEDVKFKGTVPLKVHFGEKGNNTYIKTENFNGIKKYLKEHNIPTCYIETNVLYKGSRTYTKDHIKIAKKHGFDDLPIVIADGDDEQQYNQIEINKKHFKKCLIGYKFKDYDNYIVLAHFKGHGLAGFGASIKQLAMGFASRGGKLNQHSESVPVISDKCIGCKKCVGICPVNAIEINKKKKARIDNEICIGCASCTAKCPINAITNTWDSNNFLEKLAEYAYAATIGKKNIYFNFAFDITKNCDCYGSDMKPIMPNIGIFASTDPVSIDTATLDKAQNLVGEEIFKEGKITLKYSEDLGLGEMKYNIIEM